MATGKMSGGGAASDMAGMVMGMNIAGKMMNQMNQPSPNQPVSDEKTEPSLAKADGQKGPNFCSNCGNKTEGAKFCSNCGQKLV
jgi:membrane protease subunit (stomatin/prohibitin family)